MRRADTRSGTTSTTTAGPRTTARDLQNLSQIDFLELIAEIVSLHPQFIVKVRKACGRTAGRCPQPIDYEKIQDRFNDYVTNRDVDFDPDCHAPVSEELEKLIEKVVASVNFNSSLAVLDKAFRCLCEMEESLLDDAEDELDEECIVGAMLTVGEFWSAMGGPTGPNGASIKKLVAELVRDYGSTRDYEEFLEEVWGITEDEMLHELQKPVTNPRKRGRVD